MIRIHGEQLRYWGAVDGQDEWNDYFTHLTGNFVNWKLSWLIGRAIVRGPKKYVIELMGLERIQPYASLRFLRQFGLEHDVPLWSRTALFEDDYNGQISIPRVRRLQD